MKRLIAVLAAVAVPAFAQQRPPQPFDEASYAELVNIKNLLIQQQQTLMSRRVLVDGGRTCLFEGKSYTEGAMLPASNPKMVCTGKTWGTSGHNDEPVLVWEPIDSQRLENPVRQGAKKF